MDIKKKKRIKIAIAVFSIAAIIEIIVLIFMYNKPVDRIEGEEINISTEQEKTESITATQNETTRKSDITTKPEPLLFDDVVTAAQSQIAVPESESEKTTENPDVFLLPGWQDLDENGDPLPPYSPQESTSAVFIDETLIIPLE